MTHFTAQTVKQINIRKERSSTYTEVYHNPCLLADKPFKINNLSKK